MSTVLLHEEVIEHVSDPDTYAMGLVMQWENSEAGIWAREHCKDYKIWYTNELDNSDTISDWAWRHGHKHIAMFLLQVFGNMSDKDYAFYRLKYC